jgi:hypothetical protein
MDGKSERMENMDDKPHKCADFSNARGVGGHHIDEWPESRKSDRELLEGTHRMLRETADPLAAVREHVMSLPPLVPGSWRMVNEWMDKLRKLVGARP